MGNTVANSSLSSEKAESESRRTKMSFQIILRSASAARRQILAEMGYGFTVMTADIDEKSTRTDKPDELVMVQAEAKIGTTDTAMGLPKQLTEKLIQEAV